jgi:hypothetical protein
MFSHTYLLLILLCEEVCFITTVEEGKNLRSYHNLNMGTYGKVLFALQNSTVWTYLQEHIPSVTRVCVLVFPSKQLETAT